jgi:hypothetical protein
MTVNSRAHDVSISQGENWSGQGMQWFVLCKPAPSDGFDTPWCVDTFVIACVSCCCWRFLVLAGWFEHVYNYVAVEPISEADAEGKHFVDPYTFSLKFYKPAHGSY